MKNFIYITPFFLLLVVVIRYSYAVLSISYIPIIIILTVLPILFFVWNFFSKIKIPKSASKFMEISIFLTILSLLEILIWGTEIMKSGWAWGVLIMPISLILSILAFARNLIRKV